MPDLLWPIPNSLRWRLQAWYALILLVVIATFAVLLYFWMAHAERREVDTQLEADLRYLDVHLRRFPPWALRGGTRPSGAEMGSPGAGGEDAEPPRGRGARPFREGPRGPFPPERPLGERPRDAGRDVQRLVEELELPSYAAGSPEEGRRRELYFAVWLLDGRLFKGSPGAETLAPPVLRPGRAVTFLDGNDAREAAQVGPGGTRILVGISLARDRARFRSLAWRLAGAGLAVLAVGLAGGWVMSARIFRPLATISATAAAISASDLSTRIPVGRIDRELVELATTINAMLDRLQMAFEQLSRFTADASHELRTPLTILQTHAELALARPRSSAEYQQTLQTSLQICERLSALVEGLLTLARADRGQLELRRETLDLGPLVEECVRLLEPLAQQHQLSLTSRVNPALVCGDPARLRQVVTNLLANAIQYNHEGGSVEIRLTAAEHDPHVVLEVVDSGVGIDTECQRHLFERFYRVDQARARASGGTGLGLAISKCIVEAHGGQIGCESAPGRGSRFWIRLPRAPVLALEPRLLAGPPVWTPRECEPTPGS